MFFNKRCNCKDWIPPHVHSVEGYTALAGDRCDQHKHCFNAVVGRVIPYGDTHVHEVCFVTDINDCHCHKVIGTTGPAIPTGCGNHIHIIEGCTTYNDGHKHYIKVATGIEEPICRD
jgi:hypothetical protein